MTYHHDRSMDSKQPDDLNAVAALAVVRRIAQDSSRVILVSHAMARQRTRHVTRRQIEVCLQRGVIDEGPFLNGHGHWQMTMRRNVAGDQVVSVVAIDWPDKVIVITVFR